MTAIRKPIDIAFPRFLVWGNLRRKSYERLRQNGFQVIDRLSKQSGLLIIPNALLCYKRCRHRDEIPRLTVGLGHEFGGRHPAIIPHPSRSKGPAKPVVVDKMLPSVF
jgi:hypothetical protein